MKISHEEVRNTVLPEIRTLGGNISDSSHAYKILYGLAKAKGIYMNGSAVRIASLCNVKKSFVILLAKRTLEKYVSAGLLDIPQEFKMKGRY
jgi:hypothetical protein